MDEGERSPLLGQDAVGLQPPPSTSSPPASSCPCPSPQEDCWRAWGCGRCPPGTKRWSWRGGLPGGRSASLPRRSTCIKYLTFLFNFLFSLLGLLSLATGLQGLAIKGPAGSGWGCAPPTDLMLGLALGGLAVSAVSLAGCLGALCQSACLLRGFSAGLLTCLVLEAVAGTLVAAFWGPLRDGLDHALHVAIIHYQDSPDLCLLLDQVQLGLRCCGATSYQDWQLNPYFNCSSPTVQACSLPASCCVHPGGDSVPINVQCGSGALRLGEATAGKVVHQEGCGPRLQQWLGQSVVTLGGGTIVVVVVQGAELLLAAQLLSALTRCEGAVEKVGQKPDQLPAWPDCASLSTKPGRGRERPHQDEASAISLFSGPVKVSSPGSCVLGIRTSDTWALPPACTPP